MAESTNVVTLPVKRLTFSADDFMGFELTTKYDDNRTYVVYCQLFLECSPKQMKEKIAVIYSILAELVGGGVRSRPQVSTLNRWGRADVAAN
jgi:hypothetical protein